MEQYTTFLFSDQHMYSVQDEWEEREKHEKLIGQLK